MKNSSQFITEYFKIQERNITPPALQNHPWGRQVHELNCLILEMLEKITQLERELYESNRKNDRDKQES
jgi:hypothetical protein